MGCFNIQGCISQLPIRCGERVAGIFCKIHSSLDYANIITHVGDYTLEPICPIIYGTCDEYGGLIPDNSYTVKLLEEFFNHDINHVIKEFVKIGNDSDDLKNLIEKRNMDEPRTIRVYEIQPKSINNSIDNILLNHWCLVLEHESIIKEIINDVDNCLKDIHNFNDMYWETIYNLDRNLCLENGLTKWNNKPVFSTLRDIIKLPYPGLLFPVNPDCFTSSQLFGESLFFMDLFRNYECMFSHMFDLELKQEYIDTIKFQIVINCSHIKLLTNLETGHQYYNGTLWKNLSKVYKQISDKL